MLFARFIILFLTCCLLCTGIFSCTDYTYNSDDIITKEVSFIENDKYSLSNPLNECENRITNEVIVVEKSFFWGSEENNDIYPIIAGFNIKPAYTEYVNRFERVLSESGFKKGTYYTGDDILEGIRNLVYVDFEERGYSYPDINVSVDSPVREDRKIVTIEIKSIGGRDHIDKINIVGNKNVTTSIILNSLSCCEDNTLNNFTDSSLYTRRTEEIIYYDIKKLYFDLGYVKVDFNITVIPHFDIYRGGLVDINIIISEGVCYLLTDINVAVLENKDILNNVNVDLSSVEFNRLLIYRNKLLYLCKSIVTVNEDFCYKDAEDGRLFILSYLKTKGYINVVVTIKIVVTESNNSVILKYVIQFNERVKVRFIVYKSNFKTQDLILRGCCTQQEGTWVSYEKLVLARDLYINRKFSSAVQLYYVPITNSVIDVVFEMMEIEQNVLAFNAITDTKLVNLHTEVDFRFKNMFGTGHDLKFYRGNDPAATIYTFEYLNTGFGGSRFGFGCRGNLRFGDNLYKMSEIFQKKEFTWFEDKSGFDFYITYLLGKYHRINLGAGVRDYFLHTNLNLAPYDLHNYIVKYYPKFTSRDYFVFIGYSYNSITNPLWPISGFLQEFEVSVCVPPTYPLKRYRVDYHFNKYISCDNGYFTNYILNLRGRGGYGGLYNESTATFPFFRNFHNDSGTWVRGVHSGSGGSLVDNVVSKGNLHTVSCGGNFSFCVKINVFLRSKYLRTFDSWLRPGFYTDVGVMLTTDPLLKNIQSKNVVPYRVGCGLTAMIKNPVGSPIEFSIGRILNMQETDSLEFGLGGFIVNFTLVNTNL